MTKREEAWSVFVHDRILSDGTPACFTPIEMVSQGINEAMDYPQLRLSSDANRLPKGFEKTAKAILET